MHMEYRQFAKPAAVLVLGAGAAAWAIVNSGGSGDAAPEQSFIPDTARNAGVLGHPRISGRALINPAQGSASKFDNIKAEYMTASCVSCHVNRGRDFTPPALRTKDGDPGPAYYLGGEKGTVFNATSKAFEQESPAITEAGLTNRFKAGEIIFEGNFVPVKRNRFGGLGPTYIKSSCLACHPGYGRGQRTGNFDRQYGNGYLAFVHNPDGTPVKGYTGMLQTKAVPPFVPYAKGVKIEWHDFVDQYGNKYPDGTPYNAGKPTEGTLTYPTADVIEPLLPLPSDYRVSIESTIGIYGTGLLDAIRDEDIIAEYRRQQSMTGPVKGVPGKWIDEPDGTRRLGKFTWDCSRATLENGPGANALWNVTNVTRKNRPNIYMTPEWLEKQKELGIDVSDLEGPQEEELSMQQYEDFMVWHRGLAVPAARNLDKPDVRRGQELFNKLGCAGCHKPEWTTGEYKPLRRDGHLAGLRPQEARRAYAGPLHGHYAGRELQMGGAALPDDRLYSGLGLDGARRAGDFPGHSHREHCPLRIPDLPPHCPHARHGSRGRSCIDFRHAAYRTVAQLLRAPERNHQFRWRGLLYLPDHEN